ncbi:hypothetical protein GWE18_00500 [Bradyrhizobium sp. CSA112]|uniref:hypothetical protein n=1 Tax=Bradyrhizobium sp. CSA112 TaxID=2699170 RepID=UPI0023B03D56|nr:hypothetical protein [Bradyrhizobium sp. CSA112]MDE5451356.1 hypothetical protein [Bradyrhizobium sp. CSA112]
MNKDSTMSIIVNDLDSMVHRIEALEAHPELTKALASVQSAKAAMILARVDIHQSRMRERFAKMDARDGPPRPSRPLGHTPIG